MEELFNAVWNVLIETTPKFNLERYDCVEKTTNAVNRVLYPAIKRKLSLDLIREKLQKVDAVFLSNGTPLLAVEHENISDSFVAEEIYKLLRLKVCKYNIGITYETNPILRELILNSTSFLYRKLQSNLKIMIILGSSPRSPKEPYIRWQAYDVNSERISLEKECSIIELTRT